MATEVPMTSDVVDASTTSPAAAAGMLPLVPDSTTVAAAAAVRQKLQDAIARHERDLADARRQLEEADAAADGAFDGAVDDDAAPPTGDATAVAALHTQALGILNIRALVPVVLDLATPSFSKWRRLMLLALGKYALADHVLCDASFHVVPHWVRMDLHVLSWLYGSVTGDLYEIVTTRTPSARGAWIALEQQFTGNRETRVLLVDTEFRTLQQGALSVSDYCRRMKTLADSLTELGETVTDRALAMNVLCGLSDRFSSLRLLLKRQRPFPSFVEIRSELLLEELTTAPTSLAAPPTVLAATTAAAPSALIAGHSTPPHAGSGGSSKNRRRRNHSGRSGSAGPSAGGGASASGPRPSALGTGGAAWPTMYNPWTGTLQMWPGPVQGPRATGSSRQAGPQTAFVATAPGLWPSPWSSPVGWPTTGAPEPVPQMPPAGGPPAPPTLAPLPL
eukprot:XP_008676190.1 uncharacterized protein LOC103652365 [Zea mays]